MIETRQDRLISFFGENNIVGRVAAVDVCSFLLFVLLSVRLESAWLVKSVGQYCQYCRIVSNAVQHFYIKIKKFA